MKTRLLRKCRRKVGCKYRILTRKHKHKIHQIMKSSYGDMWCTVNYKDKWMAVTEDEFWISYRYSMIVEARRILGYRIFKIKTLG